MTDQERADRIDALLVDARAHHLAGELAEAKECAVEAAFLLDQAHDEHRASFLPTHGDQG